MSDALAAPDEPRPRIRDSDPPQLTDHYHKARKNYTLFSGLLLAWVFVGLNVPKAPFDTVKITLDNESAMPLVLIALMVFFGFRTVIEWQQNSENRRMWLPSRLDVAAAHVIAVGATLLFLSDSVVRPFVIRETGWWIWLMAVLGGVAGCMSVISVGLVPLKGWGYFIVGSPLLIALVTISPLFVIGMPIPALGTLMGALVGSIVRWLL